MVKPYIPNTRRWQIGDIVIHRADAKTKQMLMVVLGYNRKNGLCRTKYVEHQDKRFKGVYENEIDALLDPVAFEHGVRWSKRF